MSGEPRTAHALIRSPTGARGLPAALMPFFPKCPLLSALACHSEDSSLWGWHSPGTLPPYHPAS